MQKSTTFTMIFRVKKKATFATIFRVKECHFHYDMQKGYKSTEREPKCFKIPQFLDPKNTSR
jgi:hypothetical protein